MSIYYCYWKSSTYKCAPEALGQRIVSSPITSLQMMQRNWRKVTAVFTGVPKLGTWRSEWMHWSTCLGPWVSWTFTGGGGKWFFSTLLVKIINEQTHLWALRQERASTTNAVSPLTLVRQGYYPQMASRWKHLKGDWTAKEEEPAEGMIVPRQGEE